MAGKTVSFNALCDLGDSPLESVAKWVSCNGEVWGIGPTAVFASAAALFLYHELEATVFIAGDQARVSLLEKTLVSTMVLGMLALMIHLWVCSMRFFQYYLDTLIRDSPNMLLEMTTAGLLGGKAEMVPLGPLTRFLRQQQPQIHITVCWFVSLCYADYVRKNYCQSFNMPYLEQWQAELHERASQGVSQTMQKVNSFVGAVQQRLRGFQQIPRANEAHTESETPRKDVCGPTGKILWGQGCRRGSDSAISSGGTQRSKDMCVRLVSQSSESTVDAIEKLRAYITVVEWAKCGDSITSALPTVLWAVGATMLAHRVLEALFRRFLFRRVPLWEVMLQHLLFVWMVIYSLHFWMALVKGVKVFVELCYDDDSRISSEDLEAKKVMQQWVIWIVGATPLVYFVQTRPRPESPPLMIWWITTSPWQRREMGPYGYYLHRPLSTLQSTTSLSVREQALTLRRAFSDSKIIMKAPSKKKRHSKSV